MTAAKLLLLLCSFTVVALGSVQVEEQLRTLEEERRAAIKAGDFTTLARIYAADFSGIVGNGRVLTRDELFAVFGRANPGVAFATDEIGVRVFGDTALFTGRLVGRADGKVVSAGRFTHVFIRRDGQWVCVAGQSTPLALDAVN